MGHFSVHYASTGSHELQIAWADSAFVSGEIFMIYTAREKVGDGLLASVRVVGESSVFANGEMVQHEKRAEVA